MVKTQNQAFRLSCCPSLKADFQGSPATSDPGLLLVRELDERLGLGQFIREDLTGGRRGKNTQLPFSDPLRQSVYSRLFGYEDLNDAEPMSQDPTFRLIGSEKIWEGGAALPSRLHWFETEVLTQSADLRGPATMNRKLIARVEGTGVAVAGGARDGQHRDSGLRRAGTERLQQTLRIDLLSPAAARLTNAEQWI